MATPPAAIEGQDNRCSRFLPIGQRQLQGVRGRPRKERRSGQGKRQRADGYSASKHGTPMQVLDSQNQEGSYNGHQDQSRIRNPFREIPGIERNGQPSDEGGNDVQHRNQQELPQVRGDGRQSHKRKEPDEEKQQLAEEETGQIG